MHAASVRTALLLHLQRFFFSTDNTPKTPHTRIPATQGDSLSSRGAVKAFRCQLPRANPFYSFHPPAAGDRAPPKLSVRALAGGSAWDALGLMGLGMHPSAASNSAPPKLSVCDGCWGADWRVQGAGVWDGCRQ